MHDTVAVNPYLHTVLAYSVSWERRGVRVRLSSMG